MNSTNKNMLRLRREALGISQQNLAEVIGISKSLLSHIENGNRQPSHEQIKALAQQLHMPADILSVSTGRLPKDVQGAVETQSAEVVAAVRQCTENIAVSYPTEPAYTPLPKNTATSVIPINLEERITVNKTSTAYRAHSYHTKVPPEAITPFIKAFTKPGDTVLDPFCGSGMTGVAAIMEGRNALLSDLSAAAVHISRNYTAPCNPETFSNALARVEDKMKPTIDWLYRPLGEDRLVEYTTWSDIFSCPECGNNIVYWELIQGEMINGKVITCPHCSHKCRKTDLIWEGEKPVQSHTSAGSNRIDTHAPTQAELDLIHLADSAPIPYWIPDVAFGEEREMWRASHRAMGIKDIASFFSKRNLHVLAALRHNIIICSEGREREALMFAFTAAVNRASKRYQWNKKRPTNVMTGTLYISSLRYEWNVWSLFKRKAADVMRFYKRFPQTSTQAQVYRRSATDLNCIPDDSVDMVFMDPPFGSNIFYADASILWEAWLGELTNTESEIVVNKKNRQSSSSKDITGYGALMSQAFAQTSRVLKPGGRAVLVFSNSDDKVWQSIQKALVDAGFETESVHILYKGQPSIKGVKGFQGIENVTNLDLMLCLKHREDAAIQKVDDKQIDKLIDDVILLTLRKEPKRNDEIYTAVIRKVLQTGYSVAGITMPSVAKRCLALGAKEIDNQWTLTASSTSDFIQHYLASAGELPESQCAETVTEAIGELSVPGGRNSPFYNAHSYHTKVPPEAIKPFIEHYSAPGDVVLDPFCGSGMTGVASAMAGRKTVLNDLSPAAMHLAWNHTQPCDPKDLIQTFADLEARVAGSLREIYQTIDQQGRPGLIYWTLWSTKHRCSNCQSEFLLWKVMERNSGRLGREINCPECQSKLKRSSLENLGSYPALISYKDADGKRHERAPNEEDITYALSFDRASIKQWYPQTNVEVDREMYIRCALQRQGIETVADFYTPRNLQALAILWEAINDITDERLKRVMAFAFTNTAWHGTRMRRFNARGGQRPLTGTLYIPQLSSEANVLEVMRNKIKQLSKYYATYVPQTLDLPKLQQGSATSLKAVRDNSIDYIFTDPPFGANIFYADCNLIWESWLGRITETTEEAVMNRSLKIEHGGKSLDDYANLMRQSMKEMARVLKPGGWATVVFHNSEAKVWQSLRDAALEAGFDFHEATSLDRKHQSHKGYKGRSEKENVAHYDVIFNLRKPVDSESAMLVKVTSKIDLEQLIASLQKDKAISSKGLQGVHAEVMRRMASDSTHNFFDYSVIREIWERLQAAP